MSLKSKIVGALFILRKRAQPVAYFNTNTLVS